VLALLIGALAYWLGVGSFFGQQAEASLLDASDFTTHPPAPLSLVSTATVLIALGVIGLITIWSHGVWRALMTVCAGAVAIVTSQLLKRSWLERPELFEFDAPNTFPSGHMTVFSVVAVGTIWAVRRGSRGLVTVLAAVMLSVVSWQLLEYGWHRPSDLIGSQALVVLVFAIAAAVGPRRSKRAGQEQSKALMMLNRATGVLLVIFGAAAILVGVVLVAAASSVQSAELMLKAGEILLVGVSVLSARTFAALSP
jgi:hypothetical protein